MTPTQLARRDAIMARAQTASERWRDRTSPEFQREMKTVADDLEALAHEADRTHADPLERARVWRFLGNAFFDLGDGLDHGWLRKAADAFARSEALSSLLNDELETTKLNYSYGHTLFHLASGGDWNLLVEARRRYALTLQKARRVLPDGVSDVEEALANADRALALLGQAGQLTARIDQLKSTLESPEDPPPPPTSGPTSGIDSEREMILSSWESLKHEFEEKRSTGEIKPDRAESLADIMSALDEMVGRTRHGRTLGEASIDRDTISSLQRRMLPFIQNPSQADTAPDKLPALAGRLIAHLEARKTEIGLEGNLTRKTSRESGVAIDLYGRLAKLISALRQAHEDEAKTLSIEREQARPLLDELRRYARRHNPALAQPIWSTRNSPPDPNLFFFSGPEAVRIVVEKALLTRGLNLSHMMLPGADIAETRWDELRASGLAVFDLTEHSPQVFYEVGMALVTGVEFVLVAQTGTVIPFDIAQAVRFYSDAGELSSFLQNELDPILYGVQNRGLQGSSVRTTALYAEQLANAESALSLASFALQQLNEAQSDPIEFRAALTAFSGYLSTNPQIVIYPRWPISYPDPLAPRCFVVMPFRRELDSIWNALARECDRAGIEPVRGDLAEGQAIIASIWEEIGRATYIIGDLTGLNPNVCLELGIADALGRRMFLIGAPGTEKSLFPNLAKQRCHPYSPGPWDGTQFGTALRKFLAKR